MARGYSSEELSTLVIHPTMYNISWEFHFRGDRKTLVGPKSLGKKNETWTLNLETIRALESFERKALRTIFGPVKDQGCWRTRYNFELYRLYKEPQVTQVIRSNRLRWLGHIWRSPENNQTRAYTFKNPVGSRTRGRPPIRWIDDVENDLKTLNIKNWQRVAVFRWNWRKRAVEAAKTCNRTPFRHLPKINGRELDLQKFYNQVTALGGLQKVIDHQKWDSVIEVLKLPKACVNFALTLRQIYIRPLRNVFRMEHQIWQPRKPVP
ncbi:endonuclease-reverse transcriptase [Trichonephila clavipes]|nr:endonuclease-reverse transcriptase [Trichonephila clavipes]